MVVCISSVCRTSIVIAAIILAFAGTANAQVPVPVIKEGEKIEGELKEPLVVFPCKISNFSSNVSAYVAKFHINLKAGQTISVTATVIGKDRQVAVSMLDPTGAPVDGSLYSIKTNQHTFEEVSATGKYTIFVGSPKIGPFTIRVGGAGGDNEVAALEARIERLEKELAEARSKLRILKEKNRGK